MENIAPPLTLEGRWPRLFHRRRRGRQISTEGLLCGKGPPMPNSTFGRGRYL